MSATLRSFVDIFSTDFGTEEKPVQLTKIEIPKIQRDYAQGRDSKEVQIVRNRFLQALFDAVTQKPITLDFIYGDINENGVLVPLDGQQRLTTLFLLHWYAAKKDAISDEACVCLQKFSYETRFSARKFCEILCRFNPDFASEKNISLQIINQSWFPLEWKKDPTISAMLNMLDAIAEQFKSVNNLWQKLCGGAIKFYFLPIKNLGLTDDLYIKMNSRGKPLTKFEHFKAELERNIKIVDEDLAKSIIYKIDTSWTDLLWNYKDRNKIIDDKFLNYFKYICSVIYYKNGESCQGKNFNEFNLVNNLFSSKNENAKKNIQFLEQMFDCWLNLPNGRNPQEFQSLYISLAHAPGKIIAAKTDVFKDCLETSILPLGTRVLLYAIVVYLMNRDSVTEQQFIRRLRIIQNLIRNSSDEISDSLIGQGRNRMPNILKQVDSIVLKGCIDDGISANFNVYQLKEEKEKITWVEQNDDKAETLYKLEDHELLYGQVGILGLDNIDLSEGFSELFKNPKDIVMQALMMKGNYAQYNGNLVYQLGSPQKNIAWEKLFHQSSGSQNFEITRKVLIALLTEVANPSETLLKAKILDYLNTCESRNLYCFEYYYVKYPWFRKAEFGKYQCSNLKENPYNILVMQTKTKPSENSYQPFLRELGVGSLDRENHGRFLKIGDLTLRCDKKGFLVSKIVDGKEEKEEIRVNQDEKGIDIENRIEKMKQWLREKNL